MDREKVVKGIRKCLSHKPCSVIGCPYENECAVEHLNDPLLRDALALLKEQEATIKAQQFVLNNACEKIKEQMKEYETKYGYWINPTSQDCHCSECGEQPVHEPGESVPLYDYCPYCGAKMEVKWNE